MNVKDWLVRMGYTHADLEQTLVTIYGRSPTKATLSNLVKGVKNPGLEIAIMINEVSKGEVSFNDMLYHKTYMLEDKEVQPELEMFSDLLEGID